MLDFFLAQDAQAKYCTRHRFRAERRNNWSRIQQSSAGVYKLGPVNLFTQIIETLDIRVFSIDQNVWGNAGR